MFKRIRNRIDAYLATLEDQRLEQLCTELRKNVAVALARVEEAKQTGRSRYWTQLNVPNFSREHQSPGFPFFHWSPEFSLRVQRAFEPILKDFFDMLERESLRYEMSETGFMKGRLKFFLAHRFRILPLNRYGDSPFWRYYVTINARSW